MLSNVIGGTERLENRNSFFCNESLKIMMETDQQTIDRPQLCIICLSNANRSCTMCYNVHYCSQEHQLQDLPVHQGMCRKETFHPSQSTSMDPNNVRMDSLDSYLGETWCQNNIPCAKPDELGMFQPLYEPTPPTENRPIQLGQSLEDELFSCLTSEFLSSDNNLWDLINSCEAAQNLFDDGAFLEKEPEPPAVQEPQPAQSEHQILGKKILNLMGGASIHAICSNVVRDLNKYGICVLDKFLGENLGSLILDEVSNLYSKGIFKKGELVAPNPYMAKENIRSDVTTWVNGTEEECVYIGHLMQVLDIVMTTCNKLQDSGALAKYKLHRRTKAMIACYPGDGTHYKKHIDNPHKDGRCVTCIYYLNKHWNTEKDGGMLRMFPSIMENDIAEIEPIFDRMIFFWSDKRNPHEVLRAFRTRFAITVWYFDADERDSALMKSRDRARITPSSQRSMNISRN